MIDLRLLQIVTGAAFLVLAILAVFSAVRWPERARVDNALLFSALGLVVLLGELSRLSGQSLPLVEAGSTVAILSLPYLLLRIVDNVRDVPPALLRIGLALSLGLSALLIGLSNPDPRPVLLAVFLYLVLGILASALLIADQSTRAAGIRRRRLLALALGVAFLGWAFALALFAVVSPANAPTFGVLLQLSGLASGLAFWAGLFPPQPLRQSWRVQEILRYLRATRWSTVPSETTGTGRSNDAYLLDALIAAVTRATGARRTILAVEDRARGDFFLWGAPSARVRVGEGLIGRAVETGRPVFLREARPTDYAPAVQALFEGTTFPRTVMAAPLTSNDRVIGAIEVVADKGPIFVDDDVEILSFFASEAVAVLREREYRETVEELAALKHVDRLKDEFMAVVSHELRTPLTAIGGYADILARQIGGTLNERQQGQVAGIRDAARRLLALINDLLDVSRLESGTVELRFAAVDPREAVERAHTAARVLAGMKGVTLESDLPDGPLPAVQADEARLQQVLSNLLANAIKFTPAEGVVRVGARAERTDSGLQVAFVVEDSGIGIPPDQIERVWDRFYQVDSTSSRRFGGTGLGLSIAKRLVELHGGRIAVHSAGIDRGSTFVVRLPAIQDAEVLEYTPVRQEQLFPDLVPGRDGSASELRAREAPLVLVVEDDPDVAQILRTYLETDGYRVAIAGDGRAGLSAARRLRPFAITLDVMLPRLDGWSVLNALKRDPEMADIPVIVVSIVDNRDFGMVLGATDYLVKPIDHGRLKSTLARLVGDGARGDGSILVVDDDPSIRDVVGQSLAADGWRVRTADDGASALKAVADSQPSVLVLDLVMPRMDGFDVLDRLRADPATRDLPVVVLTARDLTLEDEERLRGVVERIVLKRSLSVDEICRDIGAALAEHRGRYPQAVNSRTSPAEGAARHA